MYIMLYICNIQVYNITVFEFKLHTQDKTFTNTKHIESFIVLINKRCRHNKIQLKYSKP